MAVGLLHKSAFFLFLLSSSLASKGYDYEQHYFDYDDSDYEMEDKELHPIRTKKNQDISTPKDVQQRQQTFPHNAHDSHASNEKKPASVSVRSSETKTQSIERSIPFSAKLQLLQEAQNQERERLQDRVLERSVDRALNGSYKIVNKPMVKRRGQADSNRGSVSDPIVFPGETTASRSLKPQVPKECLEMGICENVLNYPAAEVDALLARLSETERNRLRVDDMTPDNPDLAQRADLPDDIELCKKEEKTVVPTAALDSNDQWQYVVNQKDKPVQSVRVEICKKENEACSSLITLQIGYRSYCKQKYVLRYLTSYENGKETRKLFKLPSCCSCVIQQDSNK